MGWDAQSASAFLAGCAPRTALLLGYGGGTAARQLRLMFPHVRLTGIEIDPRVAHLAAQRFSSAEIGAEVVAGCGERFIRSSRLHYDFTLDDMWDHEQMKRRAIGCDPLWLPSVIRRLTRRGVYAANVYVRTVAPIEYDFALAQLRSYFPAITRVALPWEQVCVLVGSRQLVTDAQVGKLLSRMAAPILRALGEIEFETC